MKASDQDDEFSREETARRRDQVIKRMLNTPPQPRRGKPKEEKAKERQPDKERAPRPKSRS